MRPTHGPCTARPDWPTGPGRRDVSGYGVARMTGLWARDLRAGKKAEAILAAIEHWGEAHRTDLKIVVTVP